jgi:hypothetical protein
MRAVFAGRTPVRQRPGTPALRFLVSGRGHALHRSLQPLATRVREYYRTPLGAAKPHAGGRWLKTLRILNDLWVHYAPTPDYVDAEDEMLRTFVQAVSSSSRQALHDSVRIMPFANLKDPDDLIKNHGIKHRTGPMPATGASALRDRKAPSRSADASAAPGRAAPAPPATTNTSRSIAERFR